ncbi:serine protease SP24D-like [Trichogramma pretiosum]|uniref:serine protease SP24D-like n=1 Tax=Trichogramma pretiosum TaxID=7493 RepID=UPI000C71B8B7|nr:serine protease SP24D-like [Trichogramma pretiosum]
MYKVLKLFLIIAPLLIAARKYKIANKGEYVSSIEEFPYHVAIIVDEHYQCGGALISDQHVLTAAHCVQDVVKDPNSYVEIRAGSTNWKSGYTKFDVRRVAHSPDYRKDSVVGDVAIIQLKEPVTFTEKIKPIGLPNLNADVPTGTFVWIAGWGSNITSPLVTDELRVTLTNTVSYEFCEEKWNATVSRHKICTYRPDFHGTCPGDSGSPMADLDRKVVLGIVSAVANPCASGVPESHTKVSDYLMFILYEMGYAVDRYPDYVHEGYPGVNYQ